ncbi:MAG: DNA repair protein RecN [Arenicellales bacterium]
MINWLDVRNFVVVKQVQISFSAGLTVITGETGAGKSVMVDALAILLGNRASADLIRHGADQAEIQADFDIAKLPEAKNWLASMDLETEFGECTLRRVIHREKPSRGFINGRPVPIQSLKELGAFLADIHGQHEHHRLLQRTIQRAILDANAGIADDVARLQATAAKISELEAALAQAQSGLAAQREREAFLRHQVQELTTLKPSPEEFAELEAQHSRMSHTRELSEGTWTALQELDDAEESSTSVLLSRAEHRLRDLTDYDPRLKEIADQLESISVQLSEATAQLRHVQDAYDLDPAELERVDQRLGALHDAARKYQTKPQELSGLLERLSSELESLESGAGDPEHIAKTLDDACAAYDAVAKRISAARGKAATSMSKAVNDQLPSLGLEAARFEVRLKPHDADQRPPHGRESVQFEIQPGPDLEWAALERAASGGELSRISLAIQLTMVQDSAAPCTIYDEVDVGIGGRVADIVGQKLRASAGARQVLCITHLPQVAAQGHQHLRVIRTNTDETQVDIQPLENGERTEEIARMLGGVEITQTTRAHAGELLARVQ